MLLTEPEAIAERTKAMLRKVPGGRGYVANLGHGILPQTPVDNARTFVRTVGEATAG